MAGCRRPEPTLGNAATTGFTEADAPNLNRILVQDVQASEALTATHRRSRGEPQTVTGSVRSTTTAAVGEDGREHGFQHAGTACTRYAHLLTRGVAKILNVSCDISPRNNAGILVGIVTFLVLSQSRRSRSNPIRNPYAISCPRFPR